MQYKNSFKEEITIYPHAGAAQAPADLLLAAARGVVWHGCAADLLARARGQVAVQTTQLLDYLQPALSCTDHEDP